MLKFLSTITATAVMATTALSDDLRYVDELFPYQNLTGADRLNKAAECAWEGDGRCYMFVIAEVIRSFRTSGEPNPVLAKHNLKWPTSIMDKLHYDVFGYKYDNYVHMSAAIYYTHRWYGEGSCNVNLATEYFAKVSPARCDPEDSNCWNDMQHYGSHLQTHFIENCQ